MWNHLLTRLQGRWRHMRSWVRPVPVRIEQLELHQPSIRSRWFDWLATLAQHGMPYQIAWQSCERAEQDAARDLRPASHRSEESSCNRSALRFLSAVAARQAPHTIVETEPGDGLSLLYLLAGLSSGSLWTFSPIHPTGWQQAATRHRLSQLHHVASRFHEGFAREQSRIGSIDTALLGGPTDYEWTKAAFLQLEPQLATHAILLLRSVDGSLDRQRSWNVIREHPRVLWSAVVAGELGVCEFNERRE